MPKALTNLSVTALLLFFLSGCTTIYNPATQRREAILIDTPSEVALGISMDKQIEDELKVVDNPKLQNRLDIIGSRLAKMSDRLDLAYHFKIVKDDEFNAFAIPGGFIYVNSGLINAVNDDELAAVLGHELGHIAARHSVKRIQAQLGYQLIANIVLGVTGEQAVIRAVGISFDLVVLGYSRQDEFLADKLGVKYAKKAGYDPYGMVAFFRKLQEKNKPGIELVFLSSHPPVKERIERAEKEVSLEK
jgi:predicted Zn-dependent protease